MIKVHNALPNAGVKGCRGCLFGRLWRSVCRSWRYVATDFPRLWRHITVPVQTLAAQCSDPVAFLSLIVSRAKVLDLFIKFDVSCAPGVDSPAKKLSKLALALLHVLLARSTQWRTIQLIKLDWVCLRALDAVHGKLPRLTELDIQYCWNVQRSTTCFTVAPLLERISLSIAVEAFTGKDEVVGHYYDSSLVDLLHQCRDLKTVTMYFLRPSIPSGQRVPSQITALTLNKSYPDLTLVHLPQLRMLSLGDVADVSLTTMLPSLLDLLEHSRCPLISLKLINCDLTGLLEVLEVVPQLQVLEIVFERKLPRTTEFISGMDQALLALLTGLANVDLVRNLQLNFSMRVYLSSELVFFKHPEVTRMLQRRRIEQSQMQAFGFFSIEGCCITAEGWVYTSIDKIRFRTSFLPSST